MIELQDISQKEVPGVSLTRVRSLKKRREGGKREGRGGEGGEGEGEGEERKRKNLVVVPHFLANSNRFRRITSQRTNQTKVTNIHESMTIIRVIDSSHGVLLEGTIHVPVQSTELDKGTCVYNNNDYEKEEK